MLRARVGPRVGAAGRCILQASIPSIKDGIVPLEKDAKTRGHGWCSGVPAARPPRVDAAAWLQTPAFSRDPRGFTRGVWASTKVCGRERERSMATYRVMIQTGDVRGGGTTATVHALLHGETGAAERLVLGNRFDRGSLEERVLHTTRDLGTLRRLELGLDLGDRDKDEERMLDDQWYLEDIEITELSGDAIPLGSPVMFPCNRWVGPETLGQGPNRHDSTEFGTEYYTQTCLFPRALKHDYPGRWGPGEPYLWSNRPEATNLVFVASAAAVPHARKVQKGIKGKITPTSGHAGEDAYIIGSTGSLQMLGVADGVAAWAEQGIDAGVYSRSLLKAVKDHAQEAVAADEESRMTAEGFGRREESGVIFKGESSSVGTRTYGNTGLETGFLGREDGLEDERPIRLGLDGPRFWRAFQTNIGSNRVESVDHNLVLDPVELVQAGWASVKKDETIRGSCTTCLVCLERRTGTIRAANLGDSGFMIIRPIRFDQRSLMNGSFGEQDYNNKARAVLNRAPVRCETIHRSYPLEHSLGHPYQLGHHEFSDHPDRCEKVEVDVMEGDWLVLGTDGLWDNLNDVEISQIVLSGHLRMMGTGDPSKAVTGHVARELLKLAFEKSMSKDDNTPFAIAATEELNMAYSGGKQDDITVVVALIEEGFDDGAVSGMPTYNGLTMDFA